MAFGFQLTANEQGEADQAGHFMCLVNFEASSSEVDLTFEYNMCGDNDKDGEGLCAYLLDPSVEGWDTEFNGTGPMGFQGKTGALLGVVLDNSGKSSEGQKNSVSVKKSNGELLGRKGVKAGFLTNDDQWRQLKIKFDLKRSNCDVELDNEKIIDNVKFKGVDLPDRLCVAVCGAAHGKDFMISVNEVKLEDKLEGDGHAHAEIKQEMGVPEGCTDYKMSKGKLVPSENEEDWRCAGNTVVEYGFELTQDEAGQEGHLLCRVPFTTSGNEIYASLEYVMEPKSAAESGGEGLCVYLCDPSIPGWDRHFDGSGPLGFVGKKGALIGVGIDCTGTFCEGSPASIAIKRASDCQLLCDPVELEGGVVTRKDEYWRKVKVKFDIEDNKCDVTIGGHKVLDDVSFGDMKIPKTVCIGVCAGTTEGHSNHICVNKLKLKGEDDGEAQI